MTLETQSTQWSRASFRSSLIPMVLADDDRRWVAANAALCLLLRRSEDQVLGMRIEDLTPPELRSQVDAMWDAFMQDGVQEGTFELMTPDHARLSVDYSATANVEPGRHLSILMFPSREADAGTERSSERTGLLTNREREVLGMVAMGRGTAWIALEMGVSASTVETHVRHCLEKLGARNRAHAIALGLRAGEITLDLPTGR